MNADHYLELAGLCFASALVAFALCAVLLAASAERRMADGKPTETEVRRWIRKHRAAWGRREKL